MKTALLLPLAALLFAAPLARPAAQDRSATRAAAERHYAEGSFELARREYLKLAEGAEDEAERRFLRYRLADCGWRQAAASDDPDASALDAARAALEELLRAWERPEERDATWAAVEESLFDLHWSRPQARDWGAAWPHASAALGFWAASTELDLARERYLGIVSRVVRPAGANEWEVRSYSGYLPEEVVENAARIAVAPRDRGWTQFLLAQRLQQRGADPRGHARVRAAYEAVLALGRDGDWYDDALYGLGVWTEERGALVVDPQRGARTEPDYVAALALYRRLAREFAAGDSRFRDDALGRIERITGPEVALSVGGAFLPDSLRRFGLRWRNVERVDLALYALDLSRDVRLQDRKHSSDAWLDTLEPRRLEAVARWTHETGDDGRHVWGQAELSLEADLEPGAYLLEAVGARARSRELVLVSDAAMVLKGWDDTVAVWFADAFTGRPIAEAEVGLWERDRGRGWRRHVGRTDADGLALFDLPPADGWREAFAGARLGARQAFSRLGGFRPLREGERWMAYAFTDRPAYRPGQTVHWRMTARLSRDQLLETPAGARLAWELYDPRGELAAEGRVTLNDFGSAGGELEPQAAWTLGEYQLRLHAVEDDGDKGQWLAAATLFRLEEYKLPEFAVRVEPARAEDGGARLFALGDEVEAEVVAEYYFGGPVAEATVEVLVHQRPFTPSWTRPREFPWYHADAAPDWRAWYGPGQLVQQSTLRTDAQGRAKVRFETPIGAGQDLEYTIEARVTDASRREVTGSGGVRVTGTLHFVYAWCERELLRPGSEAELRFHAQDANGAPLAIEGRVELARRRWVEVWRDPLGAEHSGDALAELRRSARVFPPPGAWRRVVAEFRDEVVARSALTTDADGEATWAVTLPAAGLYVARWAGADPRGAPVTAELALWAADEDTRELGYRAEGLRILVDGDTFRAGAPGHAMLVGPASDRWALFSVEAEGLIELRVVHLAGTVRLLTLDVDARWVPNVQLVARGFSGGWAVGDQREVVVPPRERFLDVELALEPEELRPGEEGTVTVTVRDAAGAPVAAELALSLVDESVTAIQADYAGDPRQFFYGAKREHRVATRASQEERPYLLLVEAEDEAPQDGPPGALGRVEDARRTWLADKEGRVDRDGPVRADTGLLGVDERAVGFRQSVGFASDGVVDSFLPSSAPAPGGPPAGGGGPAGELTVRSDFRETALWLPSVETDAAGQARATVRYPDSLTRWRATARAATRGAEVGQAHGEARTRVPLVARLQAPRFLVVGDEVTLSLILNNRTPADLSVAPGFAVEGLRALGFVTDDGLAPALAERVTVPGGGDLRIDLRARAEAVGEARLVGSALGEELGDAVELRLPVVEHGVESMVARAGRFDADELELTLELPAERDVATTRLEVSIAPSLAVTMLDALPYLVRYPYGCTEQTLSRFLPAVIVKRTLQEQGLSPELAMARVFGGVEREHVDAVQRDPGAGLAALDRAVDEGLQRLVDFQHASGGWAWWKEGDDDPFMTGYVVWGLALARAAGVDVPRDVLGRGAARLTELLVEAEEQPELAAWLLHAIAEADPEQADRERRARVERAFARAYAGRAGVGAYARALLALAAVRLDHADEARVLVRNLIDGVILDRPDASVVQRGGVDAATAGARAHWGEDGIHRRWSDGGVEATAFALRALLAIDPAHELVQPACDWLVANRRGAQWRNTRDTAIVVLALSDFLQRSGELAREVEYELEVGGAVVARRRVDADGMLSAPASFTVPAELVRSGANRIRIRRVAGSGPLYFAACARFTSREEPVPARGSELFLRRQYFRLVPRPTLLAGTVYERVPLGDGQAVTSGERVEVVLTVEAKNHLEYVLLEDLKPAGLEAAGLQSGAPLEARELTRAEVRHRFGDGTGERPGVGRRSTAAEDAGYTGRALRLHQELRDRHVAAFVDRLPQGVWELRYDLRAEAPGRFHALPVLGHAMYVPEIRAHGAELRVEVAERPDLGGR